MRSAVHPPKRVGLTGCAFLFTDVITIEKTDENFRLLYNTKGRFVLHPLRHTQEAEVRVSAVPSFAGPGAAALRGGGSGLRQEQRRLQGWVISMQAERGAAALADQRSTSCLTRAGLLLESC